jgi:hypothetical protein
LDPSVRTPLTSPKVGERSSPNLDATARVEGPTFDAQKGVWVFSTQSPYLKGANRIEVLLPDRWNPDRARRVLYVLPVQPGNAGVWGDGLQLVRQLGSHNEHDLICVSPFFDSWPYYGSHASDPRIRHEDYILKVLVPLIEDCYLTQGSAKGRLLLGFSKSGWGSILLILRNPEVFGYACSWDAPLMMSEKNFGLYETASHFGTKDWMSRYVPKTWARTNAHRFRDQKRLVVLGRNFFGTRWLHDLPHTSGFHRVLRKVGIAHHYDNSIKVPHTWNLGWLRPAVNELMKLAKND